ncbi:MAG: hypothetical protein AB1798_02865, partial [Spirochaetota bacterium]
TAQKPDELENEKDFSAVILAVNSADLLSLYLPKIKDGGKMLLFAGYPPNSILEVDPDHIHYREISLLGSFGYASHHFSQALALITNSKSRYSPFITNEYTLEEAEDAFQILELGKAMKVIFRMKRI